MTTAGWTLIDLDEPTQRIVHIRNEPSWTHLPNRGWCLRRPVRHRQPAARPPRSVGGAPSRRRAAFLDGAVIPPNLDHSTWEAMRWLQANAPADVIFTNGAGNFSVWNNKGFRYGGRLLAPRTGRWATDSPPRLRQKRPTRTARSSALPATATSR